MKVVLFALNSSYVHTNLAVRVLRETLDVTQFETVIIEKNLKDIRNEVLYSLYSQNAEIYGFSCYIWNISEMLYYATQLKIILPECTIIFGGPEVSFCDEKFIEEHPFIDYIIKGEGEESFPALCLGIKDRIKQNNLTAKGEYLNFVESGILYRNDEIISGNLMYYESSRGCPFRCSYCLSALSGKVRCKTLEKTLSDLMEFEKLDQKIAVIKFVDRTFNYDIERAKSIWKALSEPQFTKNYHFEICASLMDDESIEILRKAPENKFLFEAGVQSTNAQTLETIGRKMDTDKLMGNLKNLAKLKNIHLHIDLIVGLPYENYDRFAMSFNDVYGIGDVLQVGFLKVLNGSYIKSQAKEFEIKFSPFPPYNVLQTKWLSFEEIDKLYKIESLVERFSNSEKFCNTFPYLPIQYGDPFKFFEKLSQRLTQNISFMSQPKVFEFLLNFVMEETDLDTNNIISRMRLDFLLGENKQLPSFLKPCEEEIISREEIAEIKKNNQNISGAVEIHRFMFKQNKLFAVDRQKRTYYEI